MRKTLLPVVLSFLFCSGCATTSDPREGGLLGYWGTGERGYQKRIDERQQDLEHTRADTDSERGRSGGLDKDRAALREQVRRQREAMNELQSELDNLRAECEELKAGDQEMENEKAKLLSDLDAVNQRMDDLQGDTSLLVQDKQKQLDALKEEVNLLLERYSLLTTL